MDNSDEDEALEDVTCWVYNPHKQTYAPPTNLLPSKRSPPKVCFALFDDPTTLPCNHSFCRKCAESVLGRAALCPFCRAPFGKPLGGPSSDLAKKLKDFSEAKLTKGGVPPPADDGRLPPALYGMHKDEWVVILGHASRHGGVVPLCRIARTCSLLRRFSEDGNLWRAQCMRDFPFASARAEDGGLAWKRAYVRAKRCERGWKSGTVRDWELKSMRAPAPDDGSVQPISAMLMVGPNDVYSANGSVVHRWTRQQQTWSCHLTGACSALYSGGDGAMWAKCHDGVVRIEADGSVVQTFNGPEPVCVAALGSLCAWATGASVRWSTGSLKAHDSPVTQLLVVEGAWLAFDNAGITHYNLEGTQVLHRHPLAFNGRTARALTHRVVAIIGHNSAQFHLYDAKTHLAVACNAPQAVSDVLYDEGRLVIIDTSSRATVHPLALAADGALPGGPLAASLHRIDSGVQHGGINEWALLGRRLVGASKANNVMVCDVVDGRSLYVLLGGSMQQRADNPAHPQRPGCSFVQLWHAGVTASFNAVVKQWRIKDE